MLCECIHSIDLIITTTNSRRRQNANDAFLIGPSNSSVWSRCHCVRRFFPSTFSYSYGVRVCSGSSILLYFVFSFRSFVFFTFTHTVRGSYDWNACFYSHIIRRWAHDNAVCFCFVWISFRHSIWFISFGSDTRKIQPFVGSRFSSHLWRATFMIM